MFCSFVGRDVAIAMPVGVVVRRNGGCVASSRMVSLVVQPSSMILRHHSRFFGSRHPLREDLIVKGDFTAVFVEEDFTSGITEDSYREEVVDEARQSVGEACSSG